MEIWNGTEFTEFRILGFYELPDLQSSLFIVFLSIYTMTLSGNIAILLIIFMEPHLHTPMYFFLSNLSILDITFTSTVLPKLLHICLTGDQTITYIGCVAQIFFLVTCVVSEYCLLAVMAYDRYMAICQPLRYSSLMSFKVCVCLALISWFCGLLDATTCLSLLSQNHFCKSNVINHVFCDFKPLLKLSCSPTQRAESAIQASVILFGLTPLTFIAISYIFIITSILRIRSNTGKRKAFSTCSSHITVIILFFGIILGMYLRPQSTYSVIQDKVFSVLNIFCIPMLNPLIYSLRNDDVKQAAKKLRKKICTKTFRLTLGTD